MRRLVGKVAIVTGSGSNEGIGAATAKRLASEGASVILADVNVDGAEMTAAAIRQAGGDAEARNFDLNDEESIRALIASSVERYGKLDILHNNAADTRVELMAGDLAIADMDAAIWDATFHANTRGTMLMIKYAVPAMLKSGGGSIINTTSGTSNGGDLLRSAYAASKAAVECLTLYAAAQYGRQGIRCNGISPGLTLTSAVKANIPPKHIEQIKTHALLSGLGVPEDLAAAVAFLASDDARNITGQNIFIDGGYNSHQPHVGEHLANNR